MLERIDTYYEQHVATLSFRIHPAYFSQGTELLNRAKQRAQELSIKMLQIHIASPDLEQIKMVEAEGFSREACLHDRLVSGDGKMDLMIYSLSLSESVRLTKSQGDYYAGRPSWQKERILFGKKSEGDL